MAAIHGKAGTVTFPSLTPINCLSWTIDINVDTAEITDMADTWKTYLTGFKDWTATVEALTDSAGSDIVTVLGTAGALVLDTTGGLAYTANGICTGCSTTTDANDAIKTTYTFQGSGSIAEA